MSAKTSQLEKAHVLHSLFSLNQNIKGMEGFKSDEKYVYIEDKHHIGDLDLLHNEANKGENHSNVITFTVMFMIMCVATVFCCYLNYSFPFTLSKNVFIMSAIAYAGD